MFFGADPGPGGYFVQTWTVDDGLPYNSVSRIVQDGRGYLWLGTDGGLCRFDGRHFKEVPIPLEYRIGGYNIRGLAMEDDHTILFLPTGGQLVRLRDGKVSLHPSSALVVGRQPAELFVESERVLWLGMVDGGLLRWEDGCSRWFGPADGLPPRNGPFTFARDKAGDVWIASSTFLGRFSHGTLVPFRQNGGSMFIAGGPTGRVWVCMPNNLSSIENGRLSTLASDAPWLQSTAQIRHVFEDRDGIFWIAAGRLGLYRWAAGGFERIETAISHPTFVTRDREQNLWIGSVGNGLGQLHRQSFRLFGSHSGLIEDRSNGVFRGLGAEVWLANNSGGIFRIDAQNRVNPLALRLEGKPLFLSTGCLDNNGVLWCGGHDGLYRVPPPFTAPEQLAVPKSNIHILFLSRNGDIWFGADPDCLGYYRGGQPHLLTAADGYTGATARAIAEDRSGQIWVGALNGDLFRFSGGHAARFTAADGLPGQSIHDLYFDTAGDLWVATVNGLALRKGKVFRMFTQEDGLADELLSRIVEDDHGNLWLSSRSGIYSVIKSELLAVAQGLAKRVSSKRLGKEQGFVDVSPLPNYYPSALKGADGRLWFATSKGVIALDPTPPGNLVAPPVFIDEVIVDDRSVGADGTLAIPAGRHRIVFRFGVPTFVSPENVRLRHQLEGADPAWVDTSDSRQAGYAGLAPGDYRLHVIAANSRGVWNDSGAALSFRVLPSWWESVGFRLSVILAAAICLGWGVRRWSQKAIRRKLERLEHAHALEKERSRIARDLHDDLGGSLTEVGLFVDRLQHQPETASPDELYALAGQIRRIRVELSSIVWTINPKAGSLDQLARFLRQYAKRLFRNSEVECIANDSEDIPPIPVVPSHQYHLLAVTKEALNNVLKHANASWVRVEVSWSDGLFRILIADNGSGFDPPTIGESFGNGLPNMRERTASIGGTFALDSTPGKGTRISVAFPCPKPEEAHLPPGE